MTLASTNGLENQRHISQPPAQLKRAGTLGITDMQLLKTRLANWKGRQTMPQYSFQVGTAGQISRSA